jgi:DNA recombination protein RmuC
VLDKTRKKIDDVGKELDNASHRSRQIEKKLRKVEELPSPESPQYQELVLEPEEEDEV